MRPIILPIQIQKMFLSKGILAVHGGIYFFIPFYLKKSHVYFAACTSTNLYKLGSPSAFIAYHRGLNKHACYFVTQETFP